jgi:hypothetical protein
MKVEIVAYGGWARNVRLSNDAVELLITLEVGPRVLHYGFLGGPNVFGVHDDQLGASGEAEWRIRGGHRLWLAPQGPLTIEPDNGPVEWEAIEGGVRVTQPAGPESGLVKQMEVRLDEAGSGVEVEHLFENRGAQPLPCSLWALSVMAPGGEAIVPLPAKDKGALPNQTWSIWPYTNLDDPRFRAGRRYVRVAQQPAQEQAFKIGLAAREGWAGYLWQDHLFVKRFEWTEGVIYPDGNVNCELYVGGRVLEVESLGPLVTLPPGGRASHHERWELHRGVPACATEEAVEAVSGLDLADGIPENRAR